MKKILFLITIIITNSITAGNYFNIENSVPSTWQTQNGGSLEISSDVYKLGSKSIKWNTKEGSNIRITIPKSDRNMASSSNGGLMFWIYNTKPNNNKIKIELTYNNNVRYQFNYNTNFKGWRACWIRFSEMDKLTSETYVNYLKIYSPEGENSTFYIDRMKFTSKIASRSTPDAQLPFINPTMNSNHWAAIYHWETSYKHSITLKKISNKEINDFDKIYHKLLNYYKSSTPSESKIYSWKRNFKNLHISIKDGMIKGKPIVHKDVKTSSDITMKQAFTCLYQLAIIYYHKQDQDAKEKFYLLMDYIIEQGVDVGSGLGTNHHYGYEFRDFSKALLVMRDALITDRKLEKYNKVLQYWSGIQEHRKVPVPGELQGIIDSWNTQTLSKLTSIILMPNSDEKLREMKEMTQWLSISLEPTPGTMGGIKVDGTTFHHGGFYPAYAIGGFSTLGDFLYYISDTEFTLKDKARSNLGKALITLKNISEKYDWGFGVCGRHPLSGTISTRAILTMGVLAKMGEPFTTKKIWKNLASIYLEMNKSSSLLATSLKTYFTNNSIKPSTNSTKFLTYNYAALGIYRSKNSMVTFKGYNDIVWNSEIYYRDNRYGRYQSYGAIQIIKNSAYESGFSENGWDWNRYPGTTTIHLPFGKLESPYTWSLMVKNLKGLSGASSLLGKYGAFMFKLNEGKYKNFTPDFEAKKSAFCFDNLIVCLGSNISNSNKEHNTETTIFQTKLNSTNSSIYVNNGNKITDFPYTKLLATPQNWILNNNSTGYYFPDAINLNIKKQNQTSRHNKTKVETTGNFTVAYIDHGKAPSDKGYEYAIRLNSSISDITNFSKDMKGKSKIWYKVLTKNGNYHAVEYLPANIFAYTFFTAQSEIGTSSELLYEVSKPSIVMHKQTTNTTVFISVCDPNLNISEKSYTTKQPSKLSVIKITLRGNWKIKETDKSKCEILSANSNFTILNFYCIDGLPIEVCLNKIKAKVTDILDNTKLNSQIRIFPNPTQNIIKIEGVEVKKISIFNTKAEIQKIKRSKNISTDIVDVSRLAKGIYFIKIETNSNIIVRKFIKI